MVYFGDSRGEYIFNVMILKDLRYKSQIRIDEDYLHTGEAQNYMSTTIKRDVSITGEKSNPFHSVFCVT